MKQFWIWMVTFSAIALTVSAATQHLQLRPKSTKSHQSIITQQHKSTLKHHSIGNQRIIKIHGTPQINHFNGHHKHVRNRPILGFPKGHTKDELASGQKHHGVKQQQQQKQQASFFSGGGIGYIKHLSLPPPHVYHKLPSYGIGFPYKIPSTFHTSLLKPPFRKPSVVHVHPTTVKTVQSSHVTQMTPISSVATKTTSASASYYSPTYTSFSFGSGPVHHIISSDDNNGPIREVPAPDLSLKSSGSTFGKGHLTSQVAAGLFTGFKDSSGSFETIATTPAYDSILKTQGILVSPLVKNSPTDVSHFVKGSFSDYSDDASFGKLHNVDVSSYDESSLQGSSLFKATTESDKQGSKYEVTEHHHIPSNDHVVKSHDGTKLYYAPDPDPSLPVYKVPPTKDPNSTPSHEQSLDNIYIPKISNGYSYLQGSGMGNAVATLTSEELYQLMQGYPTVLSHVPQPVVAFVGQSQPNSLTTDLRQNYYHEGSSSGSSSSSTSSSTSNSGSSSDIGDIAQYLQSPEIHNLLHSSQKYNYAHDSSYSPTTNYATQLEQAGVYSPQNTRYQDYYQLSQYKPFSYATKSVQSRAPQTFDTSETSQDYEPEASESRHTATVIRQTKEGTVGASPEKDSLPEDSDSNDLTFSASEDSDAPEDEPQVYHFKNIPEVPFYSSLPSEEAAKTLASLQAAGSVASNFLSNVKEMTAHRQRDGEGDADEKQVEDGLLIEEVTPSENSKTMGFYQFSGFKKLDGETKTDTGEEEEEKEETTVPAEQEEQVVADESKGTYSAVRQIVSTYQRNEDSSNKGEPENPSKQESDELESKESLESALKKASLDQTFGKRIRPK